MESNEIEKIARTEALFREVNERIAETAERLDAAETNFVCECAEPTCTHRVEATLEEYERVREDGDTFLLVPGHEDERVEAVERPTDDHAVVEKRHPLVRRSCSGLTREARTLLDPAANGGGSPRTRGSAPPGAPPSTAPFRHQSVPAASCGS